MNSRIDCICVIVPLYNAAGTIDETLASVCAQTHRALDIVVVDDGSTDDSARRVSMHVARDPRIRLLQRSNGGVAAARNFGALHARGEYLAPIDADDLWAPDKLALQLAAMHQGGAAVGLVYTWFALIDEHSRVLSLNHRPTAEGRILRDLCRRNLIGNASSALIRRAVFEQIGGYDESLRAKGAQGCEDLQLALQIAEHHEIRLVPRHLTGYRMTHTNMSSDVLQMLRSFEHVAQAQRRRHPEYGAELDQQWDHLSLWLLMRALGAGHTRSAARLMRQIFARRGAAQLLRLSPQIARAALPRSIKSGLLPLLRRPEAPSFLSMVS